MTILFIIIGALIGGFAYGDLMPAVVGGILGFLLAQIIILKDKVSLIEQKLFVRKTVQSSDAETTAPTATTESVNIDDYALTHPSEVATAATQNIVDDFPVSETSMPHGYERPVTTAVNIQNEIDPFEQKFLNFFTWIKEYFTTGNIVAKLGVIVLFFGVGFLMSYAVKHSLLSPEARLIGAALGGIILLIIGWQLRHKRQAYALILEGGGVGVLYLTIYSAFKLYAMIDAPFAFALLSLIGIFSILLALVHNTSSFAVLGILGGFLAPILASTGQGNHIVLFSHYLILNAVILVIAWYKAWRPLNLLGFIFTFVVGTLWGFYRYQPELFYSCETFLIIFFLFYTAIPLLFSLRHAAQLKNYIDSTLIFGTPLICFSLQAGLMQNIEYGLAWSSLILGAFYSVLAWVLFIKRANNFRLLTESFLALAVVFISLAIPLALSGRWVATSWALEGAAIIWVGTRQNRLLARLFGVLLQLGAGFFYLFDLQLHLVNSTDIFTPTVSNTFILNSYYLSAVMLTIAGIVSAYFLQKEFPGRRAFETVFAVILFVWGVCWWISSGEREITVHRDIFGDALTSVCLGFFVGSSVVSWLLYEKIQWQWMRYTSMALLLPIMIVFGLTGVYDYPFEHYGYLAWPAAFIVFYSILYRSDHHDLRIASYTQSISNGGEAHTKMSSGAYKEVSEQRVECATKPPFERRRVYWHAAAMWFLCLLVVDQTQWSIKQIIFESSTWSVIMAGLIPALFMLLIQKGRRVVTWPLQTHQFAYLNIGAIPFIVILIFWILYANLLSGSAYPLPYIPFLNPLDLVIVFSFITIFHWPQSVKDWLQKSEFNLTLPVWYKFLGVLLFLWLNGILLRTLHHWCDIPFSSSALMHSRLVQASLSIFWASLALILTGIAARKKWRTIWMAGALLIALLIAKLLFIDLMQSGTIERVVSFIGVGILLIIVGYISPVPPKDKGE